MLTHFSTRRQFLGQPQSILKVSGIFRSIAIFPKKLTTRKKPRPHLSNNNGNPIPLTHFQSILKMPNWCDNKIEITGKAEDIKTIYEAKMSFEKLCPKPKDLEGNDWWYWCIANWGTKWDIVDEDGDVNDNFALEMLNETTLKADFLTAWSPPCEFFIYLTRKMKGLEVKMKSWEAGCNIYYEAIIKDGCDDVIPIKPSEQKDWVTNNFGYEWDSEEEEEDEEEDEEDKEKDDVKDDVEDEDTDNPIEVQLVVTDDVDRPIKLNIQAKDTVAPMPDWLMEFYTKLLMFAPTQARAREICPLESN